MPNDILKLLEDGIDLVLLGRETFGGERPHDTVNIAHNDKRLTALMENPSFMEDAKQAFIQYVEMGGPIHGENGNWMEARHEEP